MINSIANPRYPEISCEKLILQRSNKNELKILKVFLLGQLHKLLAELFQNQIKTIQENSLMEYYTMDSKIIQFLIQGIIESGEYTLKGIANYTRIPYDVIFEAACGNNSHLSISPWAKIVELYIQIYPNIAEILINQIIELKEKNNSIFPLLSNEM